MRVGRLILVVATLVTILLFPLLVKDAVQALRLPSAYAAPSFFDTGGRVFQNGNFNDPNNDDDDDANNENDDESDNEGEDNENEGVECFVSLNDNEPVPCDFQENDNDAVVPPPAVGAPGAPASGPVPAGRRCFAAGDDRRPDAEPRRWEYRCPGRVAGSPTGKLDRPRRRRQSV